MGTFLALLKVPFMSREGSTRKRATVMGVLAILVITGTTVATRAHGWKAVTAATATGAPAAPLLRMIRSRSSTYQQASGAVGPAWCAPSHSCTHHIGCLTAFCVCVCVWPQPLAVARANGAAIGSRVYVTGGYDGSYARSYLQIFDSVTSTWSLGPNMPSSMYYHSMAASNSKASPSSFHHVRSEVFMMLARGTQLYVTGGYPSSTSALFMYTVDTSMWEPGRSMHSGRYGAVSGRIEPFLFVVGGSLDASVLSKLSTAWNPTAAPTISPVPSQMPSPIPTRLPTAAPTSAPSTLGPTPAPSELRFGVWSSVGGANMPYAQSYQSGAVVGSKFYVTGGARRVSCVLFDSFPLSLSRHAIVIHRIEHQLLELFDSLRYGY